MVMVDIDDDSIEKLGQVALGPRGPVGSGVAEDRGGKSEGRRPSNIILSEPENSAGLYEIKRPGGLVQPHGIFPRRGPADCCFWKPCAKPAGGWITTPRWLRPFRILENVVFAPSISRAPGFAGQEESEAVPILLVAQSVQNVRGAFGLEVAEGFGDRDAHRALFPGGPKASATSTWCTTWTGPPGASA